MDILLKKKRILKGRVTRLESMIGRRTIEEGWSEIDVKKVEQVEQEVSNMFDEISQGCNEKEVDEWEQELGEMEIKLHDMKRFIVGHIKVVKVESEKVNLDLRLPKINLPHFSGQYGDWVTFHDLFVASIDKNVSLSEAQKLQYLKSAVRGEAAALIKTFSISDANYQGAWGTLIKRFQNDREIMNSHLDNLVKQPALVSDQPEGLRRLVDRTVEAVRSITQQGAPTESWDVILVYLISRKLDTITLKEWELSLEKEEKPTYVALMDFLEKRAHALLAAKKNSHVSVQAKQGRVSAHHIVGQGGCGQCKEGHTLARCPEFIKKNSVERLAIVKNLKVCYNCLRTGHMSSQCKGGHCYKCPKYHHTLLHENTDNNQIAGGDQTQVTSHHSSGQFQPKTVLLGTARVLVSGGDGCVHEARSLIDSASQVNFITEALAQKLQVKRWKAYEAIHTLGGNVVKYSRGRTRIKIESMQEPNFIIEVDVLIIQQITLDQPRIPIDQTQWEHCRGLKLADEKFGSPGKIDMLLGADVYGHLIKGGICKGTINMPVAIQTHLGWVLLGEIHGEDNTTQRSTFVISTLDDEIIQQFWSVPEEVTEVSWTEEENKCEQHYQQTYARDQEGRFVVRLPFKVKDKRLGRSKEMACRRFQYNENRWRKDKTVWAQYEAFMNEYLQLNHMKKVKGSEEVEQEEYYLPHHAVINLNSTTTKLRVVYDASAKTSTGVALNDILMNGPKLQGDIIALLLRFQIPAIGMSADIAKMYRQVWIHEEDQKYLKIVWRSSPCESITDYQLCTVTYGTACAPYQAIRSLQQTAEDGATKWPIASKVVKEDFYVDDLITGCASIVEGKVLVTELRELLGTAKFDLRKWSCNRPEVLEELGIELKETKQVFKIGGKHEVKTLGIIWCPESDQLSFMCPEYSPVKKLTKRVILSELARVFDPLGWLSPITVQGKIIFQQLWKEDLRWDDSLPKMYEELWTQYKIEIQNCIKIQVPRCIMIDNVCKYELHAFADASMQAYAAVIYLSAQNIDGIKKRRLLVARTKVAPVKVQSLPRLELCAAVLTSRLAKATLNALKKYKPGICVYTDSMIVITWISSNSNRWKPFISHRVEEIQRNLPGVSWKHVPGKENPADHATRGKKVMELQADILWWQGPEKIGHWPDVECMSPQEQTQFQIEERKKIIVMNVNTRWSFLDRYSSLFQLVRVMAWILRFKENTQKQLKDRVQGGLKTSEYHQALQTCIILVQQEYFHDELKQLEKHQQIKTRSHILALNPFKDKEGVLRVGGRISKSHIANRIKYPILLPGTGHFSTLLIRDIHLNLLHGGPTLILATLRQRYWIINGRSFIRKVIHNCIICHRHQGTPLTQLMGDLPEARVNPSRPFSHCGVDYAGPFMLHTMAEGRAKRTMKGYVLVFVCFSTKAIHLELVSNLTTVAFIAALRRFCSRRGQPQVMYSDCGSNFKGADKELKELAKEVRRISASAEVISYASQKTIQWKFNPPASPHFGGLWEAAVRSMKKHLRKVVGTTLLNYEEMGTILTQIEACLNSRPLIPLSADPESFEVLTPGHFLVGTSLYTIPDADLSIRKVSLLSRWQHCNYMVRQFWKQWSQQYLTQLQQRPKWKKIKPNVRIGQLVLLHEDNLAPQLWKIGRIVEIHPGKDQLVRSVFVKTKDGIYQRPIVKLSILPINDENEEKES